MRGAIRLLVRPCRSSQETPAAPHALRSRPVSLNGGGGQAVLCDGRLWIVVPRTCPPPYAYQHDRPGLTFCFRRRAPYALVAGGYLSAAVWLVVSGGAHCACKALTWSLVRPARGQRRRAAMWRSLVPRCNCVCGPHVSTSGFLFLHWFPGVDRCTIDSAVCIARHSASGRLIRVSTPKPHL